MASHTFQRGETISIALRNLDNAAVTGITAAMKRLVNGRASGEVVQALVAEPRADLGGDLGPGWLISGPSAGLDLRAYAVDASLTVGSDIIITDPVTVEIVNSASGG